MSAGTHVEGPAERSPRRSLGAGAWPVAAAAIGLVLFVIELTLDARAAWFSYLDAWTFGVTVSIGALIFLMVDHASKASWTVVTRRATEAVAGALPLYAILFVPIALGLTHLYPWASRADLVDPALRRAIDHKRAYLNAPFFLVRTAAYLGALALVGALLRAWSRANDARPRLALVQRMRRLAGGGLPLVALTVTWASFDWTMSLEPDWSSSIFGLYFFAGAFVAAVALVCVVCHRAGEREATEARFTPDHAQAIGRVLFAMIVFWAYMAFSQLLIQWIADIPQEIVFFRRRTTGSWTALTWILVLGHFVVPFFLLIGRNGKRRSAFLASVGAWVFCMHFVDVYWLVMPSRDPAGVRVHPLDFGALLLFGGLSWSSIARRYRAAEPVPLHVPDRAEGLAYEAAS